MNEGKKILFVSVGTRGDVQPYVTFANALIQAGYQVAIATHFPFEGFVKGNSRGITFFPLLGDPDGLLFSREFVDILYKGSLMQLGKYMFAAQEEYIDENLKRIAKACDEYRPDAIIASIVTITECLAMCHKYTIPMLIVSTIPFYPTTEFPLVTLSTSPLTFGWLNRLTYTAGNSSLWMMIGARFNRYRKSLGLPPQSGVWGLDFTPIVHIYSPNVGNVPADWPSEVRANTIGFLTEGSHPALVTTTTTEHLTTPEGINVAIHNVGEHKAEPQEVKGNSSTSNDLANHERLTSGYEPDAVLGEFLAQGDKPVYIGFGSMPLLSAAATFAVCANALKQLNLRGLFYMKAAQKEDLGEVKEPHMLVFPGAPHEWLLPRCVAAVHHGGAGTTAASIRAGIPTIIFSVLGDQPYWAIRCGALGIGPPVPIPLKQLTTENLVAQIRASITPQVQLNAQKLGERVRQENGTAVAVERVHALLRDFPIQKKEVSWEPDTSTKCTKCSTSFSFMTRRHHCRACLRTFCASCVKKEQIHLWPDCQLLCDDPVCRTHIRVYTPLRIHT